jgi:galactokinase
MLLDCRDLSKQFVLVDSNELRVVIVNTMVRHELSGGEYGQRRKQCEEGVAFFRPTESRSPRAARRDDEDARVREGEAERRRLPTLPSRHHRESPHHEAAAKLNQRQYEQAAR